MKTIEQVKEYLKTKDTEKISIINRASVYEEYKQEARAIRRFIENLLDYIDSEDANICQECGAILTLKELELNERENLNNKCKICR